MITSAKGGVSSSVGTLRKKTSTKKLSKVQKLLRQANDFSRYRSVFMIEVSENPQLGQIMHGKLNAEQIIEKYGSPENYREAVASEQHGIKQCLEQMGVAVHMAPPFGLPDSHNAMDPYKCFKDGVLLARMGVRQAEVAIGEEYLKKLGLNVYRPNVCNRTKFEFGDYLDMGAVCTFVGKRVPVNDFDHVGTNHTKRTNKRGRRFAKKTISNFIGQKHKVLDHFMLHLSTAMTYLGSPAGDERIYFLANPDGIYVPSLPKIISKKTGIPEEYIVIIETAKNEGWYSGGMAKDGTVLISKRAEDTIPRIEAVGFNLLTTETDASEITDSSIHCHCCAGDELFLPYKN